MGRGVLLDVPRLRRRGLARARRARLSRRPRGSRAGTERDGRGRRRPAGEDRPRETVSKSSSRGTRPTPRRAFTRSCACIPLRATRRGSGLRRQQRHRAEHHRGCGISDPCLALNAMGMPLLDYLRLEELTAVCEKSGRWEFMFGGRTAADQRRDRIAAQPDRDPVIAHRSTGRGVNSPRYCL